MRSAKGENEKMKRAILDSRRKVAMAIVGAFPGGRECAATFLGLDLKRFDNQLYESNGHRPLSDEQLQQLEQVNGTHYLADYIAGLYNGLFTALPDASELDNVELYHLALAADVKEGQLNQTISDAIVDGIDNQELAQILQVHRQHLAALHTEVLAVIALHRKAKP
ncbi:YmfL family putative regulatory protein [Pseudomonas sp. SK2]|uniref:YmfL family putative regulatory protein n=1 Tax=Pseudomonas sp. SK2 TaxID=2841063 RepID=UPI0020787879